jgi:hypothetical protein
MREHNTQPWSYSPSLPEQAIPIHLQPLADGKEGVIGSGPIEGLGERCLELSPTQRREAWGDDLGGARKPASG